MPQRPQQARSRRTMERIVNAALAIVAERGVEEATVQDIVRRARSSVGSFYSRFSGKDELMTYLQERVWDDALNRWTELLGDRDPPTDLRAGVGQVVASLMADREGDQLRRRAFGATTKGVSVESVQRFRAGVLNLVRNRVRPFEHGIGHPEPALAIDLGFHAAAGTLEKLDADALFDLDDEALAIELERIYMGYLGGGAGNGAGEGDDPQFADPFDVWT